MESGSSVGIWIAYGAISLFLVILVAVFLRTAMLYLSLVLMGLTRLRTERKKEPAEAPLDSAGAATVHVPPAHG